MKTVKNSRVRAKMRSLKENKAGISPFPPQPKTVAHRRDDKGRCPECGAERACYSCVTSGGWLSEAEHEENERLASISP